MSVDHQHPQYVDTLAIWQLVRDADKGATAVKKRAKGSSENTMLGLAGTAYLPPPNPTDASAENRLRYQAYVDRATYVNFTAQTKEGMLGLVFRKKVEIEVDPAIEYKIKNINGGGLTSDQMIKDVTAEVLCLGRHGLLEDYPQANEGMTEAQVKQLNLQSNTVSYEAESIINWQTTTMGGVQKLSLVVLKEPYPCASDDGFSIEFKDYHRVLMLRDGVYIQQLYDENGQLTTWSTGTLNENGEDLYTADIIPRKSDGSTWDEIPFIFVGSVNNDPSVDKAPLYDIAELNIAHYRNSADFEESSFMVGQPTPVLTGLTQSWVDSNYEDGIHIGSRAAILLPEGGSGSLLQAAGNSMPEQGMKNKEEQMIKLGARLIQDQGGVETAEAAKIRFSGQNSKIASILINVEAAFEQCAEWAKMFMGGTAETEIEINKELYEKTIDPQMLIAQMQLMDRGVIAKKDLRTNMRKGNLIDSDRTDEDIEAETETGDIFAL